jgi:hypothetical protein
MLLGARGYPPGDLEPILDTGERTEPGLEATLAP